MIDYEAAKSYYMCFAPLYDFKSMDSLAGRKVFQLRSHINLIL